MEVVDAAGVVQSEVLLEEGCDLAESVDRHPARNAAENNRTNGVGQKVSDGAEGDTSGDGRVLDVDHGKLLLNAVVLGPGKGGEAGSAEAKQRVDNSAVCTIGADLGASVERRPVHP